MKSKFFLLAFLCSALFLKAQDPVFLNSNQSLIYLNPSFAGSTGGIRNQSSYRNQWPQTSYNFVTYLTTFDLYIKAIKGGLAFSWMQDIVYNGQLRTSGLSLSYAQYFNLMDGNLKIIPSFQMTYGLRVLDVSNLAMGDVIDPRYGYVWSSTTMPHNKKTYADFSSGLLVTYKNKLYIGASFFHMNQPDIGLLGSTKLPYSLNVHSSYNFKLSEKSYLQAFYLFNSQNQFWTNRVGLNLISFNHLITGAGLVDWDSPILNAGFRNNYFSLLIGYDFTLSRLAGNTNGNWEFHASFNLRNKERPMLLTSFESW